MNSTERIYRVLNNENVDRIPFSLWRHFPGFEHTSNGLAKKIIEFQKKFDLDLIKITPSSGYFAEAFGGCFDYRKDEYGVKKGIKEFSHSSVKSYMDWNKLEILNGKILEREIDVVKIVNSEFKNEVPIFQTVPNAITLAKIIRGEAWIDDIREHPEHFKNGLKIINNAILRFCIDSIKSGANGIFLFTQIAGQNDLSKEEYNEFQINFDYQILNELKNKKVLSILHIHGLDIAFDLFSKYPVHIMNWHDQCTKPSLSEAQKIFKGVVLGGIDENNVLAIKRPEDITLQVKKAIKQTNGKRLIIGPGCTIPINTSEENIKAIKKALTL
ncbi:MAG: hypothetical protein KAI57_04205 [Candidatus Pacebacteria bacterium]|nr:hypothetical protein [Candidatus Paceibacterota bacterium]